MTTPSAGLPVNMNMSSPALLALVTLFVGDSLPPKSGTPSDTGGTGKSAGTINSAMVAGAPWGPRDSDKANVLGPGLPLMAAETSGIATSAVPAVLAVALFVRHCKWWGSSPPISDIMASALVTAVAAVLLAHQRTGRGDSPPAFPILRSRGKAM